MYISYAKAIAIEPIVTETVVSVITLPMYYVALYWKITCSELYLQEVRYLFLQLDFLVDFTRSLFQLTDFLYFLLSVQ